MIQEKEKQGRSLVLEVVAGGAWKRSKGTAGRYNEKTGVQGAQLTGVRSDITESQERAKSLRKDIGHLIVCGMMA